MGKKIFTFGSCVSRDIFNHTDEKDFQVTLNIQRMSYVLMPREGFPVTYEELDMEYLDDFPWEVKMMVSEVSKTCLSMAGEADADYLVFDLVEERFDFAEFEIEGKKYRSVKTGHFENYYEKYLKDKVTSYRELSVEEYSDDEIRESFRKCVKELLKVFPIDKIILIETYYADKMVDDSGNITAYENVEEIGCTNERLKRLYRLMKQVLDENKEGDKRYCLLEPEEILGYEKHKWGPFPAHYTDDFYEEMGHKIKEYTCR